MAKRFTDSRKFHKPWYRKMPPAMKCFWEFMLSECDLAGVWSPDFELASFLIGDTIEADTARESMGQQVEILACGKWWIVDYCRFQYGRLSEDCKPHRPVIAALRAHGLYERVESMCDEIGKTHNISERTRSFVIHRDGMTCAYCDRQVSNLTLMLDHVVARKKGGSDRSDNLVVACRTCSTIKSDQDVAAFLDRPGFDQHAVMERVAKRLSVTLQEKEKEKEIDQDRDKDSDGGSAEGGHVAACTDTEAKLIYAAYPRKVGRRKALAAIHAAATRLGREGQERPADFLLERTRAYAASVAGQSPPTSDASDFRPHPATWFNADRFNDDTSEWSKPNGNDNRASFRGQGQGFTGGKQGAAGRRAEQAGREFADPGSTVKRFGT